MKALEADTTLTVTSEEKWMGSKGVITVNVVAPSELKARGLATMLKDYGNGWFNRKDQDDTKAIQKVSHGATVGVEQAQAVRGEHLTCDA